MFKWLSKLFGKDESLPLNPILPVGNVKKVDTSVKKPEVAPPVPAPKKRGPKPKNKGA
jgi:hypothetical protein